jgi:FKBP-type peptidyl-prolyl cis-trans isomerase FklB
MNYVTLIALAVWAPFAVGATLKSPPEQASYGIGYNLGEQLKGQDLEVSLEAVIMGLTDSLEDRGQRVDDATLEAAFASMRERQSERQAVAAKANLADGQAFLAKNSGRDGVVTTDSGLQYEVIQSGDEGPSPGAEDRVTTHYRGTLIDGTVFDSSYERGKPVTFGVSQVISGWTEALQMMKVGDKWRLFIPSELGYGARGAGPRIPPNSVLVFEVELLGIESAM